MSETQFKLTYLRLQGWNPTSVVMSTVMVYPHHLDLVLDNMDIRDIVDVEEVAWCGWVNSWEDSGDRGAAQADHDRHCDICPV